MRTSPIRVQLIKETRALSPMWAACVATLVAALLQRRGVLHELGMATYYIGPALLGAHAIGHEYAWRTLPSLLAQPIDRRRVYGLKLLVAAAMSLTIAGLAWIVFGGTQPLRSWPLSSLPLMAGLLAAPWLAMICRSTLAGVLLTSSIFSITFMGAALITAIVFDIGVAEAQDRILRPWAAAMIAFSLFGGERGLRAFITLQAGDSSPRSLTLPHFGSAGRRRFRPIAALIGKEVQLQQLTLTVAAIFMLSALVLAILQRVIPSWSTAPLGALVVIYCATLSLLVGAVASAEERQLGVCEWQLLQPAAAATQWLIKVMVIMILGVLLAAAMPSLLVPLTMSIETTSIFQTLLVPTIFLAAAGLYLSSLTTSGASAMVLALPAAIGTILFLSFLDNGLTGWAARSPSVQMPTTPLAIAAIPILVTLAFFNHRSVERRKAAVVWQIGVIAVAVAAVRLVARML